MQQLGLRIYAGYAGTRRLRIDRPDPEPRVEPPRSVFAADPLDALLIEALDAPLDGETVEIGFRRKEARLPDLFATVSAAQARGLHARLAMRAPNDAVAERFARLATERRARLLAFLADARRREAHARGGSAGGRHG